MLSNPEDSFTKKLIEGDMDFHTLKGEDLKNLWLFKEESPELYFTAWAEINANAEMFGGKESVSYKIKKKKLLNALKYFY